MSDETQQLVLTIWTGFCGFIALNGLFFSDVPLSERLFSPVSALMLWVFGGVMIWAVMTLFFGD
jgi:hypothetical protein|tara:strand:- start:151 stop:342 length:192 start_codon:yes stop_codon:yes gene_type:complete